MGIIIGRAQAADFCWLVRGAWAHGDAADAHRCRQRSIAKWRGGNKPADRLALGLPRLIGGKPLKGAKGERHASPAHFHVARADNGFVLRLAAFPAACLPDEKTSRDILGKLAESVKAAPAEASANPTPPTVSQTRPQSRLLPEVGSFWLYGEEKVRVSRQIPPNKVEIEDKNGEFIGAVLSSSHKLLP